MDVDFAAPVGYQEPQREIKPVTINNFMLL
jgi:hypothetical protein